MLKRQPSYNPDYPPGDGGDGPSGGSKGCSSISVTVTELDTTSAYIHWDNPNNAAIKVLSFSGRNIALNLPSRAAYRVTGLSPGTDYSILVADVNNCMGSIGFTTPMAASQFLVKSQVSWHPDGTGIATLTFSPNATGGNVQISLNGDDITKVITESSAYDLSSLPSGPPITLTVPLQNVSSTIQIKTARGTSWTGLYNPPDSAGIPITRPVKGSFLTSDYTFFGITLPGYGWGIAITGVIWGIRKAVFK